MCLTSKAYGLYCTYSPSERAWFFVDKSIVANITVLSSSEFTTHTHAKTHTHKDVANASYIKIKLI
jgi:hypothetical protein